MSTIIFINPIPFLKNNGNIMYKFRIMLLPAGYAFSYFTIVRKTLLSRFSTFRVGGIKILGLKREFVDFIELKEPSFEFISRIKTLKLVGIPEQTIFKFCVEGPKTLLGKDLYFDQNLKVTNLRVYIVSVLPGYTFFFELKILEGCGYQKTEQLKNCVPPNFLPLDVYFSIIDNMVFNVEILDTNKKNYQTVEKVDLEIETNTSGPSAISSLIFGMQKYHELIIIGRSKLNIALPNNEIASMIPLNILLTEFKLSTETLSALANNKIFYLGDLILKEWKDIEVLENIDELSLSEIEDLLYDNTTVF